MTLPARFLRATGASVTTLVALALPAVIGGAGLAFDLNRGYGQRQINQRAADMAALGAALEYQRNPAIDLDAVARALVRANGVADAAVEARLVNDMPEPGDVAIEVRVVSDLPYLLASVVGMKGDFSVAGNAAAIVASPARFAPPCILALASEADALSLKGNASILAPDCSVAAIGGLSNTGNTIAAADIISGAGDITLGSGALEADSLRYAGSLRFPPWNGALPPARDRHNVATDLVDPWEGNLDIELAQAALGDAVTIDPLSDPPTPGGANWSLSWNPGAATAPFRVGTTGRFVVPAGHYDIGALSVGGGIDVTFQPGSTITVAKGVAIGGGSNVDFGDSDVYVNGGFDSGSNGVRFGDGVLWIGQGAIAFKGTNRKGDGDVVMNGTLALGGGHRFEAGDGLHAFGALKLAGGGKTLLGEGDLTVPGGIDIAGDSELAAGSGDVAIGASKQGDAVVLAGSARLFLGDGGFRAGGRIKTAGGSRLVFGRAANHIVAGDLIVAGSVWFGAGRYTIAGKFENGTGGTVWPYASALSGETYGTWGAGYDMAGRDVTFILAGALNLAGAAKTRLSAPGGGGGIADLLFHTDTTDKSTWTGGSGSLFSGSVHLPRSDLTLAGGNATMDGGNCFMLIARTIKVTGGAVAGTYCDTLDGGGDGGSGASRIRLVK